MHATDANLKQLAMAWKKASPALRAMRWADIKRQDNELAINSLNSLFRQAIRESKPRKSSGFVQMYKTLARQLNGPNR